jgi:hypothetical protein
MAKSKEEHEAWNKWYERKSAMMESWLGKEHNMVMHAIIPYAVGGGLDLYYYPNGLFGTAIATKELSDSPRKGSSNDVYQTYELVMFTRHPVDLKLAKDASTPFGKAHSSINRVLNSIARYSAQATLNPRQTCEFPADMKNVGGKCLIFEGFSPTSRLGIEEFGLLAIIEVFRSEMNFARKNGGAKLIALLKDAGAYPFSDLDRKPVA